MPEHNVPGVNRWLRSADRVVPVRPLLGQFDQEGIAQALEGRSQTHCVPGAFGGQIVRSDAAPLEAQLEQGGGTEVRGTAAQCMSALSKRRGIAVQRRGSELLNQLLGVGDEVPDQAAEEIVAIVQLT
jgi:hypothetical protein